MTRPQQDSRLVTRAAIRARLRVATTAIVEDEAVDAFSDLIEAVCGELVEDVVRAYREDCELRRFHRVHDHPRLRREHIRKGSRRSQAGPDNHGTGAVERAVQEVENEKDAPEVA